MVAWLVKWGGKASKAISSVKTAKDLKSKVEKK